MRVIVESPYAGNVARNVAFAQAAMLWCLAQGWAPFASHLLYPQVLDDTNEAERALGIAAGFQWRVGATLTVVFDDFGISPGMAAGIAHAELIGQEIRTVNLESEIGSAAFAGALARAPEAGE